MSIFKNRKLEKTLGVILDILFALVLFFALFMAVSALAGRDKGFLGLRLGVVRSGSMEASELYVGDVVFVHREGDYGVGDVIVFYRAPSQYKQPFSPERAEGSPVWVHEVVALSSDDAGRNAYLTKGTSNAFDDGYFVPQDFVIGKAKPLPAVLNKAVGFLRSRAGIISLIICPCAAMMIYLVWELIILFTMKEEPESEADPSGAAEERPPYYIKTFMSRLVTAEDAVKYRYSAVKNALLGYARVKARVGRRCETFRAGRKPVAKLNVRGKRILLYLALDPQSAEAKYFVADVSEGGQLYRSVPCLFKISSERGVKFARELIAKLAAEHGLKETGRQEENFAPARMTAEQMVAAGYLRRAKARGKFPRKEGAETSSDGREEQPTDAPPAEDPA